MIEFTSLPELKRWVRAAKARSLRVGFVPTMGALHEGHLALVDAARAASDVVVMSVFVNPAQFGPSEDLTRYPRDLPRDRSLAQGRGVEVLFAPTATTMYPPGTQVRVVPGAAAARWEGEARPGHFAGVLTVVAKLFHLVEPDTAWFGQKDFQQVTLVRQMVEDLNFPCVIKVIPIVREPDGLALSSRNAFLSPADREQALGLSRALAAAASAFASGMHDGPGLARVMRAGMAVYPGLEVEYIAIADPQSLEPVQTVDDATVALVAARVGSTRLIDNVVLSKGL